VEAASAVAGKAGASGTVGREEGGRQGRPPCSRSAHDQKKVPGNLLFGVPIALFNAMGQSNG